MILDIEIISRIVKKEFPDIVLDLKGLNLNIIRIFLIDGSYLDIWNSLKL